MAPKDSRRPLAQLLTWSTKILVAVAAIVGICVGATKLTVALGCPEKTRTVLVCLTVGLVSLFLVGWLVIYLKNVITDAPIPGFNKLMAQKLCEIAGETLQGLPNKKRSKAILAVGLSIICVKLARVEFSLNYFATQRFKPLMDELARERIYDPGELRHLSSRAGLLYGDFMQFLQLADPVVKFCSAFGTLPEPIDLIFLSTAAKRLEDYSNSLADLASQVQKIIEGKPNKRRLNKGEIAVIKPEFERLIVDLNQDMTKLDELRRPVVAAETYYHALLLEVLP